MGDLSLKGNFYQNKVLTKLCHRKKYIKLISSFKSVSSLLLILSRFLTYYTNGYF